MHSCPTTTSMILRRNPFTLLNSKTPHHLLRTSLSSSRFRCVFDQLLPKFAVSSSLSSVFTSANAIAAASGSAHAAVTSAITHVAFTAVAIASGACLSTKVDFLWPKLDDQPRSLIIDDVDVTGYPIFNVAKAGAKGHFICKKSSPWSAAKNWRQLPHALHSHR